jgi:23S rRNA A1618 N6-methylase RlmF
VRGRGWKRKRREKLRKKKKKLSTTTIHPRNRYKDGIDIDSLREDRRFRVYAQNGRVEWRDPNAWREATRALLKRDFGVELVVPPRFLAAPLPSRLNYVHWVEDLVREGGDDPLASGGVGVDVGAGASCIYGLLFTALHERVQMICVETDPASLACARDNIARQTENRAQRLILVDGNLQNQDGAGVITAGGSLALGCSQAKGRCLFTICNPPFYEDEADKRAAAPGRRAAGVGTTSEKMTEGGEVGFVKSLIEASARLDQPQTWFTSLLGRASSLAPVKDAMEKAQVAQTRTTFWVQGNTTRYGVAWRFGLPEGEDQPPKKKAKKE